ncbi:hypothetical protein AL515_22775 [Citrobacter sp. FDAARGOS_156]|nr:hypothetical protein AL515_22775 [Citrobacter sp. FDAARGOS_156]
MLNGLNPVFCRHDDTSVSCKVIIRPKYLTGYVYFQKNMSESQILILFYTETEVTPIWLILYPTPQPFASSMKNHHRLGKSLTPEHYH